MPETEGQRAESAARAGAEEISRYLHDPSSRVVRALLENQQLVEDDILILATRKDLPPDILVSISKDRRWNESYQIRLALARNPRTPLSVSLNVARFLRLFDLEELTRSHFIPLVFRHKVETMLVERIPTMPLGNKKTIAKKAAGVVLLKMLQDGNPEVVQLCLNNPNMVEGHLFKVINRENTSERTIALIARHPNWSSRSLIKFSLARNPHTPLALSVPFLGTMKLLDLRELYADPLLPVSIRPFVHRELVKRGKDPELGVKEEIFEITEEEIAEHEAEVAMRKTLENEEDQQEEAEQEEEPRIYDIGEDYEEELSGEVKLENPDKEENKES